MEIDSIFWNNNNDYEFSSMPNNNQLNINGFYSLFENELSGEGNIALNPLFIDEQNNNYELTQNSPCIDSGINYFDFGNNNFRSSKPYVLIPSEVHDFVFLWYAELFWEVIMQNSEKSFYVSGHMHYM